MFSDVPMFFKKKQPEEAAPVPETIDSNIPPNPAAPAPKPEHFAESGGTGEDIFQGLGEDFLTGLTTPQEQVAKKKEPLEIAYIASGIFMKLILVTLVVTSVDATVRNLEDVETLSVLPICNYFSLGVDANDFQNDKCQSVKQIAAEKTAERSSIESTIIANLLVIVPRKIEALDIVGSPEVQFIKSKTGDSRMSISDMVKDFIDLTKKTEYQGEDIQCYNFVIDEKGKFNVRCEFYGASFTSSSNESKTSRMTAVKFLESLEASDFKLQNPPKTINIEKYSSIDAGIRSTFSTVTSIDLQLRYIPNNGLRR